MKHTFKYLTLFLLFTAALSSCEREDPSDQGNEGRLTEATLTFRVPGSNLPGTRALEESNHDRDIKEVTVLEFRDGKYLHSRTGTILQYPNSSGSDETKNQIKFKITLATGTCDLVILANANDIISKCYPTGISTSATKADIVEALEMTLGETSDTTGESDKWNTNTSADPGTYHIPMWGELIGAIIPSDPNVAISCTEKRELMRMVAKVNVTIQADIPTATFTLTEVHYFNYQRKGRLIPDMNNYTATPKAPTLPETPLGLADNCVRGQHWGDGTTPLHDNKLVDEIFTFPAYAGADYRSQPCVIVGGKYGGKAESTYYRIDFIGADGEHLPLLRNHKYDMVVTKISGEGYKDVQTAYSSRPMNLESQVIKWNEADMSDVVFDGVNFMSVSPGEIELPQSEVKTADGFVITVATDVDVIDGKNWTATIYHDKGGLNEMTAENNQWLRLDKYSDNKVYNPNDPSTKSQVVLTADPSTDPDARYAWIHFKAGRLVYVVKVTQLNYEPAYVWITDENGNSISSLTFSSENPVPKKFRVTWSPKSQPLQIERMPGADPFVYTDADDTSNWPEIRVEDAVDGSYEFTIDPTTYTEAQLKENPFKATSMIMRFITSDTQGNRKEAEINLRQMDYKIVLSGFRSGYYGMAVTDANVRANARWQAEIVDPQEKERVYMPVTSGNANITGGSDFKYTFNNSGAHGAVTFKFTSPDGLFDPKYVTVTLDNITNLFAKSNIVMKDGKLTFAETHEDNDVIPANSQGIFFRNGSLFGQYTENLEYNYIQNNPCVVFNPTGEIIVDGVDVPYISNPGLDIDMRQYDKDAYIYLYPKTADKLNYNGGYDEEKGLGDICRYMSDKGMVDGYWRLPTQEEWEILAKESVLAEPQESGVVYGDFSADKATNSSSGNYGLYQLQAGLLTGGGILEYSPDLSNNSDLNKQKKPGENLIYLPMSGKMMNGDHQLVYLQKVGEAGYYATSSRSNSYYARVGWFLSGYNATSAMDVETSTVRCIRADNH